MSLCKTFYIGFCSMLLLSGCSLFNSETDVVKISSLPKIESQFKPQKIWTTTVGRGIGEHYLLLRPALTDEMIYAADRQGIVRAIKVNDGKQEWQINLAKSTVFFSASSSAMLSGGLAVTDNAIYLGSERAQVYSLNRQDGVVIWQTTVAGEVLSRPVISDSLVLITTTNGMLQALDEATGEIKWTVNLDMPILSLRGESTPVVAHGAAIVGGSNGKVSAVLIQQGQLIWQQRISTPKGATEISRLNDVDMTPVVDTENDVVYAIGYNGDLVALDLRSGQIVWKREIGSINDIVLDHGNIYLVDQDDRIVALSANGGVVLWKQSELLYRRLTSPLLYKNYLVVADGEGYLHWLDRDSGRFVAQTKVDASGFLATPQAINDYVILQSKKGKIYAFTE